MFLGCFFSTAEFGPKESQEIPVEKRPRPNLMKKTQTCSEIFDGQLRIFRIKNFSNFSFIFIQVFSIFFVFFVSI